MSSTTTSPKPLPNPRLVRNGYDADGLSVFTHDAALPTYTPFGPQGSAFAIFDRRDAVPANNLDPIPSFGEALPRCAPGGVLFCITDIKPQARVPMHRTLSLDYFCVLAGEVVLVLDSGEEKTLRAGDFVVQQGANHSWFNASEEVCRILCSVVGAEKVQLADGRVFEETAFKGLPK
ncbi:hypothetical protein LMH87_011394 [Akanthomyces muscarius]|uniref:Cupin type-2 domain-containing protein n=1 Tax=Akanthomyces muscarius TaxID=2231603 RepID=A0A9W8Q9V4_AKAMU|nr:hypothetical protein LMH87_011394 [Akanthomyces muscarius]KAJ4150654.1 hypothetical protein LMH87_011394 [Akanthomyces muscarius]